MHCGLHGTGSIPTQKMRGRMPLYHSLTGSSAFGARHVVTCNAYSTFGRGMRKDRFRLKPISSLVAHSNRDTSQSHAIELPSHILPEVLQPACGRRGRVTKTGLVKLTKQDLRDACDIFDIDSTLEKKDELLIALLSHLDATYHLGISPWPSATQPGLDLEAQEYMGEDTATGPSESATTTRSDSPARQAELSTRGTEAQEVSDDGEPQDNARHRNLQTGIDLTWLGTSSGSPTRSRNVSCCIVRIEGAGMWLIDCGEGSQRQLREGRLGPGFEPRGIQRICVTHLHGDHCFGIPGMLAVINEDKRGTEFEGKPVHIVGPPGVGRLVMDGIGHMPAEIFTTPVAVTELVVNPADAHSWEMLGLGGLLTVERRGPDPDSIGVGGFEDAVCNVGRVSYVASSMSEEEASRPYRPMRRAPLPRTPSPSPGRRSPPRRRGAEAPTGRDDRDGWNGRDGREGRRVGGAQGHGVERARGLRIPGVGLGEDIIVGNRGQRGPGPAGAGGPVGRNVGRSFAVRKGYNLDQALERVPWKLREEVASYVEMDWLRWTIRTSGGVVLRAARLLHRLPCWGYVIEEPGNKKVDVQRAKELGLSRKDVVDLSEGKVVTDGDGNRVSVREVIKTTPGRKVAVLGDTHCSDHLLEIGRDCDVLVHEATFTDNQELKAAKAGHSTARMAGRFAERLGCKSLILTHFSPRFSVCSSKDIVETNVEDDAVDMRHLRRQAAEETSAEVFAASDFFTFKVHPRGALGAPGGKS